MTKTECTDATYLRWNASSLKMYIHIGIHKKKIAYVCNLLFGVLGVIFELRHPQWCFIWFHKWRLQNSDGQNKIIWVKRSGNILRILSSGMSFPFNHISYWHNYFSVFNFSSWFLYCLFPVFFMAGLFFFNLQVILKRSLVFPWQKTIFFF